MTKFIGPRPLNTKRMRRVLVKRIAWLSSRIDNEKGPNHFIKQERSALRWALAELNKVHGPLGGDEEHDDERTEREAVEPNGQPGEAPRQAVQAGLPGKERQRAGSPAAVDDPGAVGSRSDGWRPKLW